MVPVLDIPKPGLEEYRGYLGVLAKMHLDVRLRAKLDPDDVVNQTFLEAIQQEDQFKGSTEAQRKAWLRQMLLHNVLDAVRHFRRKKIDVKLEQAIERSSYRLIDSLAADQSTPSQRAVRNEELHRLAQAVSELPQDQQDAVILHHLHELTLAEVACHLVPPSWEFRLNIRLSG